MVIAPQLTVIHHNSLVPLGDSITEITCWRAFVWDDIAKAGYADKVKYVGSQNSNPQNCKPDTAGWDEHHEGHSGWLAINIANQYITTWMKNTPADIVMFMLGTNDVNGGRTTQAIIDAYTKIVTTARAANPKTKFIVDLVLPLPFKQAPVTALNQAIPDWVKKTTTAESPIKIADCAADFPTADLRDGVHPNIAGDRIIQSRISPILLEYIKESLAGGGAST